MSDFWKNLGKKDVKLYDSEKKKKKLKEEEEAREEEKKKEDSPGMFSNLRNMFGRDPAIRGARRTSEELYEKEMEARRKREEERKKRQNRSPY